MIMESSALLASSPSDGYFNRIKSFIYRHYFIIGSLFYISLDVLITICSKRLIDYASNYTFFLNQFITLVFLTLFFFIYIFCIFFLPKYVETNLCFYKLLRICSFDSISGVLYNIGAAYTTGPTIVILSQISVPMTIISSKIIRKKKYHKFHYIGTSIITLSVILTQFLFSNNNYGNKIFFNIVLVSSCMIDSISMCYREEQYSGLNMNIVGYQVSTFWCTLLLFCLNFFTLIIYSFKFWGPAHMDLSKYFTSLVAAFNCIFRGKNTIIENCGQLNQPKCDDCAGASKVISIYFILAIFIRLVFIVLMRNGSALVMILISIIKTPIVSIAFSVDFIAGNSKSSLQVKDILTIISILLGMIIYSIGTKRQDEEDLIREKMDESDNSSSYTIASSDVEVKGNTYVLLEN
ncbi:PfCRT orthologue, Chloroquine resistant transport gene [Babesia microti strain RI]|uniref:PfCRT orthologue, Chloroquine resistant transport protein n=1 Tax=Babesia microti (strain RI) TaxID=1133968 RepID=A0A1N6LY67_BABMR|nr:PfCRT orthologue, Chloroquine resistant transport gene [Babesia microti strain RI]SIO73815.1 PfCRT orthologue, Chloroquine resistant transport gene [Babesia microti strain RI]|eukprot:XP_021337873.1 PfCRT orthologue, Chloroquine resistant transport gene [Babesia microti strain RI]